jgi:hypothetical protein
LRLDGIHALQELLVLGFGLLLFALSIVQLLLQGLHVCSVLGLNLFQGFPHVGYFCA